MYKYQTLKGIRKTRWIVLLFILILIIVFLLGKYVLVVNKPIDTDTIVIEGWLPISSIESELGSVNLTRYKNIYITGVCSPYDSLHVNQKSFCSFLYSNGSIYLSNRGAIKISTLKRINSVDVFAHGDSAFGKSAHFFVAIADSVIGGAFTEQYTKQFHFDLNASVKSVGFLNFCYGNDLRSGNYDRNFYIDSVMLGHVVLKDSDFLAVSNNDLPANCRNYPFLSDARFLEAYLKELGYQYNYIVVDTFYKGRNLTWAMANTFRNYLKQRRCYNGSFNILSYDLHSKRSYVTYSKCLPQSHIGVIALKNDNLQKNQFFRAYEYLSTVADEYISLSGNLFYK
jgi:hypothetical protein